MTRTPGVTKAINQITLTDTFPNIVSYTSGDVVQTTPGPVGIINVTGQTLTVTNLVLNNPYPIITIVVTGTIVIP